MRKEDARIDAAFSLKAARNDFVHALVAWFECQFTCCHKARRGCCCRYSRQCPGRAAALTVSAADSLPDSLLQPIAFSTGPRSKPTHWKQTVFYLPQSAAISQGEALTGSLRCWPSERNPRDLEIEIDYAFDGKRGRLAGTQAYKMR